MKPLPTLATTKFAGGGGGKFYLLNDNVAEMVLQNAVIEDRRTASQRSSGIPKFSGETVHSGTNNNDISLIVKINPINNRTIVNQFKAWCDNRDHGVETGENIGVRNILGNMCTEFFISPQSVDRLTEIGVPIIEYQPKNGEEAIRSNQKALIEALNLKQPTKGI